MPNFPGAEAVEYAELWLAVGSLIVNGWGLWQAILDALAIWASGHNGVRLLAVQNRLQVAGFFVLVAVGGIVAALGALLVPYPAWLDAEQLRARWLHQYTWITFGALGIVLGLSLESGRRRMVALLERREDGGGRVKWRTWYGWVAVGVIGFCVGRWVGTL